MMPASAPRARTGRGLRDNLLWVLAAVLGAATLHAVTRVIHDTSRRRIAAGLVAQAMAEQVVAEARRRLEVTAALALAPLSPADVDDSAEGQIPMALARRHRASTACGCILTAPASYFFRMELGDTLARVAFPTDANLSLEAEFQHRLDERARAWLRDAAGERATRPASGGSVSPTARLRLDSALGASAAVTAIERDEGGRATAIVGFISDRGALARFLVDSSGASRSRGAATPDSSAQPAVSGATSTLAELDGHSIEVRDPGGGRLVGAADLTRRFRASIADSVVLGGATITVALETWQISSPLIAPIAIAQVWHLAAMLFGTIVVTVIALRSARREAQLAGARSDFLAAVSHELRMPLAQILLASETLAMKRERDEQQRHGLTSSILREARRLIGLVENVLLFSRTGAVALRPTLQTVAVDELFSDVREAVALAVEDAGNTLETNAPAQLTVRGDRSLLRQALVNLLDNAMKYGGTNQCIRLLARDQAGWVHLIVEDEGRGVPHAERQRVFEPWERLARDQSSERTGTGLGLAVVREVARACGGRVWLEETSSGGTRAVLELPSAAEAPRTGVGTA